MKKVNDTTYLIIFMFLFLGVVFYLYNSYGADRVAIYNRIKAGMKKSEIIDMLGDPAQSRQEILPAELVKFRAVSESAKHHDLHISACTWYLDSKHTFEIEFDDEGNSIKKGSPVIAPHRSSFMRWLSRQFEIFE